MTSNTDYVARLEAVRDAAERILSPLRGSASWLRTAEFDDLRATVAASRVSPNDGSR